MSEPKDFDDCEKALYEGFDALHRFLEMSKLPTDLLFTKQPDPPKPAQNWMTYMDIEDV